MKKLIAMILSLLLLAAFLPVDALADEADGEQLVSETIDGEGLLMDQTEPVFWEEDEDRILVDLSTYGEIDISDLINVSGTDVFLPIVEDEPAADIDSLIAEYAPQFNGQNVRLRLQGEPADCLQFLNAFEFGSLDVEFDGYQGLTEQVLTEEHGITDIKTFKLADVKGLTKLVIEDGGTYTTNMDMDDVFPNLTDLTLRIYDGDTSIFGNLTSRQMPNLKHLTLLLGSFAGVYEITQKAALLFPDNLETLDIYQDDTLMDPATITDPCLIAALQVCCSNPVLVNGVPVTDLTASLEADASPEDYGRYCKAATVAKGTLDDARYAVEPLSYDAPHVYGKLLFANMESGYYDFNIPGCVEELSFFNGLSAGLFDKVWEYTSPATPEELASTFGADSDIVSYEPREVPAESLADSIDDADVLVVIYNVRTQLGQSSGDETPYREDTNVVIADLQSDILYAPYTAASLDPFADSDPYYYSEGGINIATAQIMEAYNGDGYVAQAAKGRDGLSIPEGTQNAAVSEDALIGNVAEDPAQTETQSVGDTAADPAASTLDNSLSDAMLTSDILTVLNNAVYNDTLKALQDGDVITQGTVSQTASGLQQTLADLGCDIAIDGSAGPGTFATINTLLTSFGMDETDKVDAAVYAQILELLLLSTNETAARELLADEFGMDEDPGKFEYMIGCSYYAQGKYYSAKEAFEQSQYKDYEQRAAACVQPWPANGELWRNPDYYGDNASLTFEVNTSDDSVGNYFVICDDDLTFVRGVFISGTGSAVTYFPGNTYKILQFSGDTWYGTTEMFGPDSTGEILIFDEYDDDRHKTWLGSEGGWIITLNVENAGGASVGSEPIPWAMLSGN